MDLTFSQGQDWIWSVQIAEWVDVYGASIIQDATWRMQIRTAPTINPALFTWSSVTNENPGGTIVFEPSSKLILTNAPYASIIDVPIGTYVYDLVGWLPIGGGVEVVKIFTGGTLNLLGWITRRTP
jgi:hypothetical protein